MKKFAIIALLSVASQLFGTTSNALKVELNKDNLDGIRYGIRVTANNQRLTPSTAGLNNQGIATVQVPAQLYYPFNWNTINSIRLSLWQPSGQRLAGIMIEQGIILNQLKKIASTGSIPTLNITYNPQSQNKVDIQISEEVLGHSFME